MNLIDAFFQLMGQLLTSPVMVVIIILDILAVIFVMSIGGRHDAHTEIRQANESQAVQRLRAKYAIRPKAESEMTPETVVTATREEVEGVLQDAFEPKSEQG